MKILEKIKKLNWKLVVSFKTELFTECLIQENHHRMEKRVGLPLSKRMIVDNDIYNDRKELLKTWDVIQRNINKASKKIFSEIKKESDLLLEISRKISLLEFSALTNRDLLKIFKEWLKQYGKTVSLIGAPGRLDEVLENDILNDLGNYNIKNKGRIFRIISYSEKPSGIFQEKLDLIKLASKTMEDKRIKKHTDKYSWINLSLLLGDLYTEKEVLRKIKKLKQNKKIKNFNDVAKENEKAFNQIKKQYKFKADLLKKIKILKYAVWFRTARLDWLNQSCAIARPLLIEISKRINLSYEELIYCFPEEIFKALNRGKIDKKDIQKRIKKYALYSLNGRNANLIIGSNVEQLRKLLSKTIDKQEKIKGMIAYPGLVKGRVKILKDRSEFYRIKKGDILVTKLTTPDFVPVMEKSAAIITDLGGITSHAAIVSRELKIPCIVGTKIATKVLKDGDLVEVDAGKGIVKILKGV